MTDDATAIERSSRADLAALQLRRLRRVVAWAAERVPLYRERLARAGVGSDDLESLIPPRKPGLAFTLGAMGSKQHNFYNAAFQRAGYDDVAQKAQQLWIDGDRPGGAALIPDEMVLQTNLLGTEDQVKDRIRAYRDAGVTTIRIDPEGEGMAGRLDSDSLLLLSDALARLEQGFVHLPDHAAGVGDAAALREALLAAAERLRDNYPYFHPQYAGQMLKPPHPVARLATRLVGQPQQGETRHAAPADVHFDGDGKPSSTDDGG